MISLLSTNISGEYFFFLIFSFFILVPILFLIILIISINQMKSEKPMKFVLSQIILNPILIILCLMVFFDQLEINRSDIPYILIASGVIAIISTNLFILNLIRFYNNLEDPEYKEED